MTMSAGLVYVTVQQNFRLNANDPQIQLAEDFAGQLSAGRPVTSINTSPSVDMAKSLSLFIFIYDDAGNLVTGSGKINDQFPTLPAGVLDYARKSGQNRITWEPQSNVREAMVIIHYDGAHPGFVAVGRSLREVEQREATLGWQVLIIWLASLIGLLILIIVGGIILARYF